MTENGTHLQSTQESVAEVVLPKRRTGATLGDMQLYVFDIQEDCNGKEAIQA